MKKPIIIAIISLITINSFAQKNYFFNPDKIETNKYKLEFKDAISSVKDCKLAVKIENKTNDIFLLKYEESALNLKNNKINAKNKNSYIQPNSSSKKVLRFIENYNYLVNKLDLNFNGLYTINTTKNIQKIENFQLPAKNNQLTAENFEINLVKLKKKTQGTDAIFECKYTGNNFGIINPSKISITGKSKKGENIEYANDNKKNKIKILKKGETTKINASFHIEGRILDMQFATLFVKWNATFVNSKSIKLEPQKVIFDINKELTEEKN